MTDGAVSGVPAARGLAGPLAVLATAPLAGIGIALVPPDRLVFLLAALFAAILAWACIARPILLLHLVFWSAALGSIFRQIERTGVGSTSISLSGLRWLAVAGLALMIALVRWRRWSVPLTLVPMAVFAGWMAFRYALGPTDVRGIKDVIFYIFPVVMALFATAAVARASDESMRRFELSCLVASAAPWILFAIMFSLGLSWMTPDGPKGILESRPIASFALMVFCVALAVWRYGPTRSLRMLALAAAAASVGLIVFTLSRAATATAILLFMVHRVPPNRLRRLVYQVGVAGLVAVIAILTVPSLRERTFYRPPTSLEDAWRVFDASGRFQLWEISADHAWERPVVGWGPGTARPVVADRMVWRREIAPIEYPPHNEYLQVLHDGGVIGLALLLAALVALAWHPISCWRAGHRTGDRRLATAGLAAGLALLAAVVNAFIDNTFHYYVVMAPLFTLIGVAYGLTRRAAYQEGTS